MYTLANLDPAYAARVASATDTAAWVSHCSLHEAQWIAWNVREDAWFRDHDLKQVQDAMDAVDPSGTLLAADLLRECAERLQSFRDMSLDEQARLPAEAVTHVTEGKLWEQYRAPGKTGFRRGALSREPNPPPLKRGEKRSLVPKSGWDRWVTFTANGRSIPKNPDEVASLLGLDWKPTFGSVVRIMIPLDRLRSVRAKFCLPTIFNGLSAPGKVLKTDWRARPKREHRPDEPWGYARDMKNDGPGLPEVLVSIMSYEYEAECIGELAVDWSSRPYLSRTGSIP